MSYTRITNGVPCSVAEYGTYQQGLPVQYGHEEYKQPPETGRDWLVICFFLVITFLVLFACSLGFFIHRPFLGLLVLLSIIPAFVIMYFVYWRTNKEHMPLRTVVIVILWGCLFAIPAIAVEGLLAYMFETVLKEQLDKKGFKIMLGALQAYLVAALVEETLKYLCVQTVRDRPELKTPFSIVLCGVSGALGFATLENVGYITSENSLNAFVIAVMRGVMAVPSHATEGGLIGVGIAHNKFFHAGRGFFRIIAIPWFLHGTYDFLLIPFPVAGWIQGLLFLVVVATVVVGFSLVLYQVRCLEDDAPHPEPFPRPEVASINNV